MFSPYPFNPKKFTVDASKLSATQYFTDGGVYDNLGVRACKLLSKNRNEVFVSDAERRFDWSTDASFRWLMSRASRATDVLMHRVNDLEFELIDSADRGPRTLDNRFKTIKFARLQKDFDDQKGEELVTLPPDLKRRTRRIRTDLDAFSDIEVQLLFSAGLLAAKVAEGKNADFGTGITLASNGVPNGRSKERWLPIASLSTASTDDVQNSLDSSQSVHLKLWRRSFAEMLGRPDVFVVNLHCQPDDNRIVAKNKAGPPRFQWRKTNATGG